MFDYIHILYTVHFLCSNTDDTILNIPVTQILIIDEQALIFVETCTR